MGVLPEDSREWMTTGTAAFLDVVDRLSDHDLDAATSLPGWSRRHIVAHVHFNARALGRLTSWAATGTEQRMYPSPEQRTAEIENGALLPAGELRRLVRDSAAALATALDALSAEAWRATVVTAQGRSVAATEIPWMRVREVAVHAIDLDAGVGFADLPSELTAALLADVIGRRVAAGEGPALAGWLTGRTAEAPRLGPWL